MKRTLRIIVLCALTGCGAASATGGAASETTAAARARAERDAARTEELEAERRRVRELEAQLGLARAETVRLRDEVSAFEEADRRRVTRIAPSPEEASIELEEPDEEPPSEPIASDDGPRPVLRLYGPSRPAMDVSVVPIDGPDAPYVVAPPPVASIRLPVDPRYDDPEQGVPRIPMAPVQIAPVPNAQAPSPMEATPPARRPADSLADPAVQAYRTALAHLSERRLDEASRGLDGFLRSHPDHPYADNALYWRGEIQYTQRQYDGALSTFSSLIERYPRGNKVPDALLRIGLCYERLGQRQRARRVFDRLRMQYPESVAARTAPVEDA